MKILLAATLGVVTASQALAEKPKPAPDPILVALKARLEKDLSELDPKPSFTFPEEGYNGDFLLIKYKMRKYTVHPKGKDGRFAEKTVEEEGPADGGFMIHAYLQKLGEVNQAFTPQVIHEPYWDLFLDVYPVKNTKMQVYFCLSYSRGTKKQLIEKIEKIASTAAEEFGTKTSDGKKGP